MVVKELTANVDFQLTEVCPAGHRKMNDEISVCRQAPGTLQVKHK